MSAATDQPDKGRKATRKGKHRVDEVCELAANGLTDNQIALELKISKHTVVNYWRKLREKHGLANRTALVVKHLGTRCEQRAAELERRNQELVRQNGLLVAENAKLRDAVQSALKEHEICSKALELAKAFVYRITASPPYRCLYVSPSAAEFGLDIDGFMSGRCSWYDVIPAEDLQRLRELADNRPIEAGAQDCLVFRLKGDPPTWVVEIQRPYVDAATNERCFVGLVVCVDSLVRAGLLEAKVARLCHHGAMAPAETDPI